MCTLSKDDTQSPINPAAATAPQDKYKPHPSRLPATPHPCSKAAAAKVTQSYALCEGFVSSLYFPSSWSWAPYIRSWRCPDWRKVRSTYDTGVTAEWIKSAALQESQRKEKPSFVQVPVSLKSRQRLKQAFLEQQWIYFSCFPPPSAASLPSCRETSLFIWFLLFPLFHFIVN